MGKPSQVVEVVMAPYASGMSAQAMKKYAVTGHTDYVYSVAFNPNGKFVASGYSDGTIRFWDAGTGLHLKTLKRVK